jgi:hypothetical protein
MANGRKSGYWWTFGDAKGADLAYRDVEKKADAELARTLAGPKAIREIDIPRDDTGMKNPDGDFQSPAAMVEVPAGRAVPGRDGRGDRVKDPEGQQGGIVPDPTINPHLPDPRPPPAKLEW